ncbi:tyrocidine synthase 1-like [Clavelina lepadiformis]|uniref:tyrocidine synthase 1-like n=1 Tax=Clavelina lepadiformis TaxID=159417 RepID=UPI0040415859
MFERQVALTPNSTAVVDDEGRKMTFAELNEACDILADNLILKGVVRESPVGIYMERCVDYVIAFIAIFKSGGAYIPLDVSYPDVLLEDIFADAKPACVITSSSMRERLQGKHLKLTKY